MNNRTEEKLKDTSGMEKAIKALLQQAWERGYKYGYARGVEDTPISKEVKVLIDGEQVYPQEALEERLHGEWIIQNGDKVCPFCRTGTSHKTNTSITFFQFCPYCGADMRKGGKQ